MITYLIELTGNPTMFGMSPQMRVMDESYFERIRWTKVKTKSGREVLVDDKGFVEAVIVDTIADPPKLKEEGSYL